MYYISGIGVHVYPVVLDPHRTMYLYCQFMVQDLIIVLYTVCIWFLFLSSTHNHNSRYIFLYVSLHYMLFTSLQFPLSHQTFSSIMLHIPKFTAPWSASIECSLHFEFHLSHRTFSSFQVTHSKIRGTLISIQLNTFVERQIPIYHSRFTLIRLFTFSTGHINDRLCLFFNLIFSIYFRYNFVIFAHCS